VGKRTDSNMPKFENRAARLLALPGYKKRVLTWGGEKEAK